MVISLNIFLLLMYLNYNIVCSQKRPIQHISSNIHNSIQKISKLTFLPLTTTLLSSTSNSLSVKAVDDGYYYDKANNFKVLLPAGWNAMPKKTPTARLMKYQVEESLFVATQFAEGAACSITRSNARKLLYDFQIEWYFAPLDKIIDIGSPELIAELLVLQRQGDFERKQTPSTIINSKFIDASISAITNNNNNGISYLEFEFETPLAEAVTRRTLVKSFYTPNTQQLTSVWVSALDSVFKGEYGDSLRAIRDSYEYNKASTIIA